METRKQVIARLKDERMIHSLKNENKSLKKANDAWEDKYEKKIIELGARYDEKLETMKRSFQRVGRADRTVADAPIKSDADMPVIVSGCAVAPIDCLIKPVRIAKGEYGFGAKNGKILFAQCQQQNDFLIQLFFVPEHGLVEIYFTRFNASSLIRAPRLFAEPLQEIVTTEYLKLEKRESKVSNHNHD